MAPAPAPAPASNPLPPPISITPAIYAPDDLEDEGDNGGYHGYGYSDDGGDGNGNHPYTASSDRSSQPVLHVPASDRDRSRPSQRRHNQQSLDEPLSYDTNRLLPVANSSHLLVPRMDSDTSPVDGGTSGASAAAAAAPPNPFNFQTQIISTGPVKPNVGQRRGHKYKHSSISAQHQIFQEPPPRPPLALPRDLPIPTVREAWKSMSKDQGRRLYWCTCHLVVALSVLMSAHGSLAMTALSHLVFFDVGSALVCVVVEVLGNFEVWRRSSIRHPFGLERAEVLAGFAMSIFLIFGGFDLVSHNVKHLLEDVGGHAAHHPDPHAGSSGGGSDGGEGAARVSPGSLDLPSFAAIVATLVSAYGLRNHARISRIMRVSYLASLPSILSNPFHFLTLSTSSLLVLLPLLSIPIGVFLDSAMCALAALAMFTLGLRLAIAQGLMLIMSYGGRPSSSSSSSSSSLSPPSSAIAGKNSASINNTSSSNYNKDVGVADVVREIETEPSVERVDEAQFWQVHYGLCMANLKLSVARGCDDAALSRIRTRVSNLIQNRLGEGYGRGGSLRWEVSLQLATGGGGSKSS